MRKCWETRLKKFADELALWQTNADTNAGAAAENLKGAYFERLQFLSYDFCDALHDSLAGPVLYLDPDAEYDS